MNDEIEIGEEVPDDLHYANFAELQQLREELGSLLTLADALGALLSRSVELRNRPSFSPDALDV